MFRISIDIRKFTICMRHGQINFSILESTYPQDYGENKKKRESERKEYSRQNKKTELQVFYKCRMVILLKEVRG